MDEMFFCVGAYPEGFVSMFICLLPLGYFARVQAEVNGGSSVPSTSKQKRVSRKS